jgi:hypothetical protein
MATLQVGQHFTVELEPWRKRPSSGQRKAAHRHGFRITATRIDSTNWKVTRVA